MKKNLLKTILLIVLLVLAVVLGTVIGSVTSHVAFLSWLGQGASFGFQPVKIDLSVVNFTFGLMLNINAAQGILLLAAILTYTKIKIKE